MKLSLHTRIILGFGLPFIMLMFLTKLTVKNSLQMNSNQEQIYETQEILFGFQALLSRMVDIQTGQRGYIITGKPKFLEPFYRARSNIPTFLQTLETRNFTPDVASKMTEIRELIQKKIRHSEKMIELQGTGKLNTINKVSEAEVDKEIMDRLRSLIAEISDSEKKVLMNQIKYSGIQTKDSQTQAILGLTTTLIFLIIGVVFLLRTIINPLQAMGKGVNEFAAGNFKHRLNLQRNDELGSLSLAFDQMAEKLSHFIDKERRLSRMLENLAFSSLALGNKALSHHTDPQPVLQEVVDKARQLIQADYAALGIGTDSSKSFSPWLFSGLDQKTAEKIGRFPRPVCLLEWVARNGETIRLSDLKSNAIFGGFPEHHPDMGPMLGVPIQYQRDPIGNLYLTRKPGAQAFTGEDQQAIELLASQVGIIMENLKLQQELQKSIVARQDLLVIVSHDLKGPLTTIALASEIINKKSAEGPDIDIIVQAINSIQSASRKMKRLIDDLLDAAAVESGSIQINSDVQDVRHILMEIENDFKPLAQEHNVLFEVRKPAKGIAVLCDFDRIQQVLGNLIGNALKFTPPKGMISVSAAQEGGSIVITVSDTGRGISQNDQMHLFDRFWQVQGTKEKGTGLGLYISAGIINAHGAKLSVDSQLGKGSTFRFSLKIVDSYPLNMSHSSELSALN